MTGSDGEMKKLGNWLALLMYLLIGVAAGIIMARGAERLAPQAGVGAMALAFGLLLLGFYAAMALQIAVHEGGHWLFGRLTGYRFVSYRIFSLMWLKDGSGLRFCRFSLAGTGGQCLMEPPGDSPEADFPVTLYNLGGSLLNLIFSALCFALAHALKVWAVAGVLLRVTGAVGVGFALVNGVPLTLNLVSNDGRNAIDLRRDAAARRAFWIQMKVNALTARGVRLRDMPAGWFTLPDRTDNALTATLAVLAANRRMDERSFAEADALMAGILAKPGATPGLYLALLASDRAFLELIGPNRPERVDALLDKPRRKALKAMKGMPSVLRTEYALALRREHDAEKARALRSRFDALEGRYPYPVELAAERELMDLVPEEH